VNNLDESSKLPVLDPGNMYGAISSFPSQIRAAAEIGEKIAVSPSHYEGVKNIIVCGMGGSAIGGELALSLLYKELHIPMYACRNYALPSYAGPDSLVIGSSYSGNTEETLSAFKQAIREKCHLFALTTGGELLDIARKNDIPHVKLPETGLQPRAALGYSFVPLMHFFNKINFSTYEPAKFLQLADFLARKTKLYGIDSPTEDNPAKQLANKLYGRIPILYSGPTLTDAVGTRIKGQISENAKMLAFGNQFPEFNHNELVGWKILGAARDLYRVVILRDADDHPQVTARMDIVKQMLIERSKIEVIELYSEGDNPLERIFSLIQIGDYLSYYLALLNNADPTPVEPISYLKDKLAGN